MTFGSVGFGAWARACGASAVSAAVANPASSARRLVRSWGFMLGPGVGWAGSLRRDESELQPERVEVGAVRVGQHERHGFDGALQIGLRRLVVAASLEPRQR